MERIHPSRAAHGPGGRTPPVQGRRARGEASRFGSGLAFVLTLALLLQALGVSPASAAWLTPGIGPGHAKAPACSCCECSGSTCCAKAADPAPSSPVVPVRNAPRQDVPEPPTCSPFLPDAECVAGSDLFAARKDHVSNADSVPRFLRLCCLLN